MEVSEKISQLRKDRGLTQVQLAKLVGVTDAAIRSYESGSRKPKEEHLRRMAKALGIRQEALAEYGVTSLNEAMQSVFRMEDSHMRAKPVKRGDQYYITFDEASLRQGIQEWASTATASSGARSPRPSTTPGRTGTIWACASSPATTAGLFPSPRRNRLETGTRFL